MTTEFVDNPCVAFLNRLEHEKALRDNANWAELERLIRENELLKARMEAARVRLIALASNPFRCSAKIKEIGESLK